MAIWRPRERSRRPDVPLDRWHPARLGAFTSERAVEKLVCPHVKVLAQLRDRVFEGPLSGPGRVSAVASMLSGAGQTADIGLH